MTAADRHLPDGLNYFDLLDHLGLLALQFQQNKVILSSEFSQSLVIFFVSELESKNGVFGGEELTAQIVCLLGVFAMLLAELLFKSLCKFGVDG